MIRVIGIACVVACAAMVTPRSLAGITVVPFAGGDAGYDTLTGNGLLEQGAAEARIGNRIDAGTWETALWRRNETGPILAQGQLTWQSGLPAPFTLTYDGAAGLVYTVGGETISSTQLGGTFSDIFIRTRSATLGSVQLSGMVYTPTFGDAAVLPDLGSTGNGTINYLRLREGDGSTLPAFTVTGFQTLSWQANDPPINSQVNALFLLTNIVPGPSSLGVAAVTGVCVARRRRR